MSFVILLYRRSLKETRDEPKERLRIRRRLVICEIVLQYFVKNQNKQFFRFVSKTETTA